MVKIFTDCSERALLKFEKFLQVANSPGEKMIELDLEAEFSSLALDIIGLSVFNYDFGSVTKESPVIKVHSLRGCFTDLSDTQHDSTMLCIYITEYVNNLFCFSSS